MSRRRCGPRAGLAFLPPVLFGTLYEESVHERQPSAPNKGAHGQEPEIPFDAVGWNAADAPTSLTLRELVCTACSEAHAVLGDVVMLPWGSPRETFRPAWSIRLRMMITREGARSGRSIPPRYRVHCCQLEAP